jgi:hypothetical protein
MSGNATVVSGAILPTNLHPGQSAWLTDLHAETIEPASTTDQLWQLGVRKLHVVLEESTLTLSDGAYTSTADLAKDNNIQIPDITLVYGRPIDVKLGYPKPLVLGPLATHGSGVYHLGVGETQTQVTAETANDVPLFTAQTVCPTPNPPQLLATVNVAGKPKTGQVRVPGTYPVRPVPPDSLVGSTAFTYSCHIAGLGTTQVTGYGTQFGAFGPGGLVFPSGERLPFQDTQGAYVLNPRTVDRVLALVRRRGEGRAARWIRFTLDHVHFTAVHLLPSPATLSPYRILGTTGQPRRGHPLTLSYPQPGTVLKPFYLTAGSPGIADEWLGDSSFSLQPVNRQGNAVGSPLQATCPTPKPLVPVFPAVIQ